MSVFARFAPRLQEAIVGRLGWSSLRPVQEQAATAMLDGKNTVILAPTAGGKTEASMFPVLSKMVEKPPESVSALYIAPIKALLNNQAARLGTYTEMVGLRRFLWHGDVGQADRKKFINDPAALLMTTPESLEVMLMSARVPAPRLFSDLRFIVIDEVHAMAGTDRGAHLMSVIERIRRLTDNDIQRAGLSATVGNPDAILTWLTGTSERGGEVIDPPKKKTARQLAVYLEPTEIDLARHAAKKAYGHKSLMFCETRATSESIADHMRNRRTEVHVHHSSVSLEQRQEAEAKFEKGENTAIVCTSTMELGIDVGDLDYVFQTGAPSTVSSFLQRMGRTGRRPNSTPNMTFFCLDQEHVLQAAALIELAKEGWVEPVEVQTRCWPALVHQTFAITMERGSVPRTELWNQLRRVPDFSGIDDDEFDEMVDHMVSRAFLFESSGRLAMGEQAERSYGRRNWMELYAVFSTPQYYRVFTGSGADIGSLEQSFIDRLVEDMSSFLLGGRAWLVQHINHKKRQITVTPAPRGKKPSWGGFVPKLLGYEVCQRVATLLRSDASIGYLDDVARAMLDEDRAEMRSLLLNTTHAIQHDEDGLRWWTYAGGRINHTLKYALAESAGWKVVADNYHVRIEGGATQGALEEQIQKLRTEDFWNDIELWKGIISRLPPYRLSKFQAALPPRFESETIGRYMLDAEGTRRFLSAGKDGATAFESAISAWRPKVQEDLDLPPAKLERSVRLVDDQAEAGDICRRLRNESYVALDIETTLLEHAICVIQLATHTGVFVLDARALSDLSPVAELLEDAGVTKIIHNAAFERDCFAQMNISIANVFDTMVASRKRRGREAAGGHSLRAVCARELGIALNKSEQKSDWRQRPLSDDQLNYAALDVDVLIRLWDVFEPHAESAS